MALAQRVITDPEEYVWRAIPGQDAHQFPVNAGWMQARCGERWTARFEPLAEGSDRCPDCVGIAEGWAPGELMEVWGK